jgi:hypothetical protein
MHYYNKDIKTIVENTRIIMGDARFIIERGIAKFIMGGMQDLF